MKKIDNLKESITAYMNGIPVEKRKGLVITFSVIVGLLFILKCVISIATTDKPKQTIGEKIDSIKTEVMNDYEELKRKKEETTAQRDSFIMMIEKMEQKHKKDTLNR